MADRRLDCSLKIKKIPSVFEGFFYFIIDICRKLLYTKLINDICRKRRSHAETKKVEKSMLSAAKQ